MAKSRSLSIAASLALSMLISERKPSPLAELKQT